MDNKIYYFEKSKKYYAEYDDYVYYGHLLGEIQSNFSMAQTIDGTKDSMSCQVYSSSGNCVEPWTIVWHKDNDTWWIVSHDKVERYAYENGFAYIHNLQLLGAIELLNARDLTDCAFNQNDYNLAQVITKLINLSNFDIGWELDQETDINPYRITLDHVKTFENYTLLTALRELLDEYNCCPKLDFYPFEYESGEYYIDFARIMIKSKTGFINGSAIDISVFDDVKETKTIDKNSFGSCVVSNADNVVSTHAKTYPSLGSVKLSSTEWEITTNNAILRLPTKVFKANWLKIINVGANCNVSVKISGGDDDNITLNTLNAVDPSMPETLIPQLEYIRDRIITLAEQRNVSQYWGQTFYDDFTSKIEEIADKIIKRNTTTIYEGNQLTVEKVGGNYKQKIIKGANVPYIAKIDISDGNYTYRDFILANKETRDMLEYQGQAVYWERGSDRIDGFKGMSSQPVPGLQAVISIENGLSTDLQSNNTSLYDYQSGDFYNYLTLTFNSGAINIPFKDAQFKINYIPMNDIKIKVDNESENRDIQLYNQNGKLTDSVALSKLLNSHAKEITSDNITRYKLYYDYSSIPQIGEKVINNGVEYVINNISYDFTQNDNGNYFIECEFTMSKAIAVKSMLVNPNTNVRDYGIPQNYNVKRKQVYRDYYELNYDFEDSANQETPYYSTSKTFAFSNYGNDENDFICQIGITYDHNINGYSYWCYQLETTTYLMNKSKYVVCDFKDNNIIGYSFMNMYSGFDITRLFDSNVSVNTPISYVDENGKFESIKLLFLTPAQLNQNILSYKGGMGYGGYYKPIYNVSCFIDSLLFAVSQNNHSIEIEEQEYDKDALEVPVFEYACQIANSDNVLIGDNILNEHNGMDYLYGFVVGNNLTESNVWDSNNVSFSGANEILSDGANIQCLQASGNDYQLLITHYNQVSKDIDSGETTYSQLRSWTVGKDYAFFRYAINHDTQEVIKELLFIAKKVPETQIRSATQTLVININHWKLK